MVVSPHINSKADYIAKLEEIYKGVNTSDIEYTGLDNTDGSKDYKLYYNKQYLATLKLIKASDGKWMASTVFSGDHDYVIEGVLEACATDQELLDNVMRPEKSYIGAFQYLFEKARQGYCTKVGNNVGIMDKNDALKYTIDYFNTDEEKVKAKKEAEVKAREEARKKAAAEKKKASGKKSTKNTKKKGA
jgi:hypothetical protein